ncbi:Ubiquitin-like-specific protease ESD4 [Bienertia sinuspersici]
MFPNNNIRRADLIFVPTHLGNHFTVLVFNVQKLMIEDIDNLSCFAKFFCKVIESSAVVLKVFTIGREGLFLLVREVIRTTSIVVFIS